jgi:hypothetical protein
VTRSFRLITSVLSTLRRPRVLLPLALMIIALLCGSTSAQQLSADERARLQAQKDALFQQMLRNPSNLDVAFAYADTAAKLGDNEAAISALERMLLFNPNLPRVQLEVGTLYFRLGSYEIARTYFERAAAANPPPEVTERIQTYLNEMERLSSAQRFSGFIAFGAQHQTNANLAGAGTFTSVTGVTATPLAPFLKTSDWNGFATGTGVYTIDLGGQAGDTLEIAGLGFGNRYGTVSRLNLALIEATAGPRFSIPDPGPSLTAVTLKPYAIANDVSLGDNQYFHTFGVGGEGTALAWGDLRLKSVFEFRQKSFNDAGDRPLSHGFNGNDKLVSVFAVHPITTAPDSELTLEFDYLNQDTAFAFYANNSFTGSAAYRIRYSDPTGTLRRPMDTTLFVSRTWANYDGVDPVGTPFGVTSNRADRKWRFGVTQSLAITSDVAIFVQLQRDIVSSNVPPYAYNNTIFTVGPQIRF